MSLFISCPRFANLGWNRYTFMQVILALSGSSLISVFIYIFFTCKTQSCLLPPSWGNQNFGCVLFWLFLALGIQAWALCVPGKHWSITSPSLCLSLSLNNDYSQVDLEYNPSSASVVLGLQESSALSSLSFHKVLNMCVCLDNAVWCFLIRKRNYFKVSSHYLDSFTIVFKWVLHNLCAKFMYMCVYLCEFMYVTFMHVPKEARGHQIPYSWSYKKL